MRIIDADAIDWSIVEDEYGKRTDSVVACEILIENQSTIDAVEVVHGEWMAKNSHTMYCSVCGFEEEAWRTQDYGYCPNCGAKMREREGE